MRSSLHSRNHLVTCKLGINFFYYNIYFDFLLTNLGIFDTFNINTKRFETFFLIFNTLREISRDKMSYISHIEHLIN